MTIERNSPEIILSPDEEGRIRASVGSFIQGDLSETELLKLQLAQRPLQMPLFRKQLILPKIPLPKHSSFPVFPAMPILLMSSGKEKS